MATGRVPTTANSPLTAKGDLFGYSTTQARVAVGSDGDTLVADSAATTGLRWQGNYAAGKNKIINGDFTVNQRAFSSGAVPTISGTYTLDRWKVFGSFNTGTTTYSVQTFTPGTAPVTGYESINFFRALSSGTASANTASYSFFSQFIEDVRTFANQTVTISFWAKAASGTPKVAVEVTQSFGSGGSPSANVNTYAGQVTLSTSWTRYSVTVAVPSISGKTIGTTANTSSLVISLWNTAGSDFNARTGTLGLQDNTFDFWGVQVEAGNVATAFQTATGTIQGEIALAQRYYEKSYRQGTAVPTNSSEGYHCALTFNNVASGKLYAGVKFSVTKRANPTMKFYSYTSSTLGAASNAAGTDLAAGSAAGFNMTDGGFAVYNNSGATINQTDNGFIFHWTAESEL
jgi:hypothetical protein